MSLDARWRSLRELDAAADATKGAAFRVFKQLNSSYHEGVDYLVLDHRHDGAMIEELRTAGRLYASSVNVVLLGPTFAAAVLAQLRAPHAM